MSYTSEFTARNDAAGPGVASYVLIQTDQGYELFVSFTDRTGASLAPLTQFGFHVSLGARR